MAYHNYYCRQSEREYKTKRITKTFRLHPDRVADLEHLAESRNYSQARVIEELIAAAAGKARCRICAVAADLNNGGICRPCADDLDERERERRKYRESRLES